MSSCNVNEMQADNRRQPRQMQRQQKTYFMSIWPTDGCIKKNGDPFRCRYCFYQLSDLRKKPRPVRYMSMETADQVVDFINTGQVNGISFFGGEPLCNWPVIERILLTADEMKLRNAAGRTMGSVFSVTTNGVHFNKERLRILKNRFVHIILSFDGTKETQDGWRDNSYDDVMQNLDLLTSYPSITVTKTLANPETFYEDVKHIKELGFKFMFTNFLDPYGAINYEHHDLEAFKETYKRTVKDFHMKDGFTMGELNAWKQLQLQEMEGKKIFGCGFVGSGLGIDPEGYMYQCHQGPTLPKEFRFGHVSTGVDYVKEAQLRQAAPPPSCAKCSYQRSKCYVNMYHKHGEFGHDPPLAGMLWERGIIELVQEITGLPQNKNYACGDPFETTLREMLVATTEFKLG